MWDTISESTETVRILKEEERNSGQKEHLKKQELKIFQICPKICIYSLRTNSEKDKHTHKISIVARHSIIKLLNVKNKRRILKEGWEQWLIVTRSLQWDKQQISQAMESKKRWDGIFKALKAKRETPIKEEFCMHPNHLSKIRTN